MSPAKEQQREMVARRAPATPAATGTRRWPAGAWPDAAIVARPRAARLAGMTDARALPSGAAPPMHTARSSRKLLALSDEAVAVEGFAPVRHAAPKSSADAVTQLRWARERCRWHNGHGRSSSSGHGP